MWIWVQGPLASDPNRPAPKLDDPKKIIVWKILPPNSKYLPLNEIPTLTYGVLPSGWEQEIPEQGTPPPMLEGFVYKIHGITSRGPKVGMCVLIQGGKAVPYQRKGYCE